MAIVLVMVLAGCVERVAPGPADASVPLDAQTDVPVLADSAPDVASEAPVDIRADLPADCGGCGPGLTCCANRWAQYGDAPAICVDLKIHPEHCGSCGNDCGIACQDGHCVESTSCADGGSCPLGQACSPGGAENVCCPVGTEDTGNPVTFHGCCPAGVTCGCNFNYGGNRCPISRRSAKRDVRYLTVADVDAARERLLAIRLADYEYIRAPGTRHLGFIIDDVDEATARACVAPDGEHVDLYGYASLAVAAVQAQQRELDELRRQVEELRRLVRSRR
jgi:hypothetical protein